MNAFFRKHSEPMIIAHRGASADAPENTLAAFREAIRQKADAIELDVQLSRDNKLIVMHDPWLNRTTDGRGLVYQKTLNEIKSLDAGIKFSQSYRGQRVPTLDEVLETFGKKTNYVIELKFYRLKTARFARMVYDAVASRGLLDNTMFLSFDYRLLVDIEKNNSAAKTCWAFIPLFGWKPAGWMVARFDALAIASRRASRSYTNRLHKLGKPVNLWTGSKENYSTEINSRSDFITTNHPAELRRALAKLKK